ncbi:MAG: anion permease, partial [Verrucomicrobiaceae bacterium]|nr:anion permease [Verrucomicrobiaceae bacterium]
MARVKPIARWLAPVSALVMFGIADFSGMERQAAVTLGIAWLTATWWMTEAVPIPVASLVPIALLPLLGVLPAKTAVAQSYGHPLVLLLLGGFLLSKGMEKSGVHRRIALGMVRACGGSGGEGVGLWVVVGAGTVG